MNLRGSGAPIVIRADSVFDGVDLRTSAETEILVIDGRIAELGDRVPRPDGAGEVDLRGYTVSPGFIDAHVHSELTLDRMLGIFHTESSALKALQALPGLRHMLDAGFTTVRDCGGLDDQYSTVALKQGQALGLIRGPEMLVAPHILGGTGGHAESPDLDPCYRTIGKGVIDGPDAIRAKTREEILGGADWIKVALTGFFGLRAGDGPEDISWSEAELRACVEAAADYGKDVAVHALGDASIIRAVRAGARSIEHATLVELATLDAIEASGVFVVPTMRVVRDFLSGAVVDVHDPSGAAVTERPRFGLFAYDDKLAEVQHRIASSDVKIVYGSDTGGKPPMDAWQEFTAMVGYGVSPVRALRSATSVAAEMLRRPDLGALRVGATANIIAMAGDPIADITATSRVSFVMQRGTVHRRPE